MPSFSIDPILCRLDVLSPSAVSPSGRLVSACAEELAASGVGLGLVDSRGSGGLVAATGRPARAMEELRFTVGEGPSLESSRSGRPVLVPDLASVGPSRWPLFTAGALEAEVRAVFAFPLQVGGARLGVLELYRDRPGALRALEVLAALDYAHAATSLLLHLQAHATPGPDGITAIALLDDRAEVHQATGIVAVEVAIGMAQALLLLKARAFAEARPVAELAREVIARSRRSRSA